MLRLVRLFPRLGVLTTSLSGSVPAGATGGVLSGYNSYDDPLIVPRSGRFQKELALLPVSGLTKRIGLWIESIDPDSADDDTRAIVSGLVALTLEAASGAEGCCPVRSERDPLADAFRWAAAARADAPPGVAGGHMDLAAPVVAASLATASCHPSSSASLGAAILAGCELGLLLAEMAALRADAPLVPLAAACAAAAGARVLGLGGDRLVSAIGIGISSSVGAAAGADVAWQAGKSAANGVLAALLAESGFTGPSDAIEHRRGLMRTVLNVRLPVDSSVGLSSRIAVLGPLVLPENATDPIRGVVDQLWSHEGGSEPITQLAAMRRLP